MIEITGSIEHCQSAQGMVRCFVGWASFGLREDHKGVRSLPLLRLQTLLAFSGEFWVEVFSCGMHINFQC